MKTNLYLIPGLAADARMYSPQVNAFSSAIALNHLSFQKGETLSDYAQKFIPFIDQTQPFVLVGSSMGGMVAIELTRFIKPQKLILLASIKSRKEFPLLIRSMRYLKLHRFISGNTIKTFTRKVAQQLNNSNDKEITNLLIDMVMCTDAKFIEHAMEAIVHWQPPTTLPENTYHIHGSNDRLFPVHRIKNAIVVKGGTHVLNLPNSQEVNQLLLKIINS